MISLSSPYNPTEGKGKSFTFPFLSVKYKGICMTIKQDRLGNTGKLSNMWGIAQIIDLEKSREKRRSVSETGRRLQILEQTQKNHDDSIVALLNALRRKLLRI